MSATSRPFLKQDSPKDLDYVIDQITEKVSNLSVSEFPEQSCKISLETSPVTFQKQSLTMPFKLETAIKLIPSFDGDSTKLQHFIACCDSVFEVAADKDIKSFLDLLKSKLLDLAFEQTFKYNEYTSWDELKKDLKNEFSELYSCEHLQMELVNISQKRDETVKEYARRVQELLSKLNEACIRNEGIDAAKVIKSINSKTALRAFQEGLHDHLKLIVKACRFSSLQESLAKACEEELAFQLHKQKTSSFSSSKQQVKCQLCFKLGHTASTCYLRNPRQLSNQPSFSSFPKTQGAQPSSSHMVQFRNSNVPFKGQTLPNLSNQTVKPVFTCTYCKCPGHRINYCFKRRKANAYKNLNNINDQTENCQEPIKNDATCPVRHL